MPSTKKLLNLLREKRIGKLISLEADFGFQAKFDPEHRLFNPELGGGALLDIGIYPVFLSLLCLGKPHKIKTLARKSSTGVDGFCSMLFDYSTNEKALLQSTFEYESPTEAKIIGTKGSIKLHSRFHQSQVIEIFDQHRTSIEVLNLPYQGNGYIHEINEVNSCIEQGKTQSELLPLEFSVNLAEILEQVKKEIGLSYKVG